MDGDMNIDPAKLSLRINIPTLIAILAAGVTGYAAWSQTNAKAEDAQARIAEQNGQIKEISAQQTIMRDSQTEQKIMTRQLMSDMQEIKQAIREMAQDRNHR